jgi:hypothetical protein
MPKMSLAPVTSKTMDTGAYQGKETMAKTRYFAFYLNITIQWFGAFARR